jgi:hypothetical protein
MTRHVFPAVAAPAFVALALLAAVPAAAQQDPQPADPVPAVTTPWAAPTATLTPAQLEQLVAPVALYPDPLLANVLAAATYPLEVVQIHRWLSEPENASLGGDDLITAVDGQDWDASVKALSPFPQVIATMDTNIDWVEHLGEAFLAQPSDVMDAVQRLRQRAESAGTLRLTTQEAPVDEGGDIAIEPTAPQQIYVPSYNPWCAYGAWPNAPVAPFYYTVTPSTCGPGDDYVSWGDGTLLSYDYLLWGNVDWRDHHLRENHGRVDQPWDHQVEARVWHHDPAHRIGAAYRDARNAAHYHPPRPSEPNFHYYGGSETRVVGPPFTARRFNESRLANQVPRFAGPGMRFGAPGPIVHPFVPRPAARAASAPVHVGGVGASGGHR